MNKLKLNSLCSDDIDVTTNRYYELVNKIIDNHVPLTSPKKQRVTDMVLKTTDQSYKDKGIFQKTDEKKH